MCANLPKARFANGSIKWKRSRLSIRRLSNNASSWAWWELKRRKNSAAPAARSFRRFWPWKKSPASMLRLVSLSMCRTLWSITRFRVGQILSRRRSIFRNWPLRKLALMHWAKPVRVQMRSRCKRGRSIAATISSWTGASSGSQTARKRTSSSSSRMRIPKRAIAALPRS